MICRWRLTGESSIRRCSIDKLVNKPFDPVSDIISYYTALNHLIFRIERHHLSRWGERSDQCHPRLKLFETSLSSKKQYPILRFLELLLICVSRRTNDESTWLLRSMLSWGVLLTYSIFTNAGIFPRDPTLLKYVFNGKEDQKQTFTSRHSSLLPTSSHPLNVVNVFFDQHLTYEDSFLVHRAGNDIRRYVTAVTDASTLSKILCPGHKGARPAFNYIRRTCGMGEHP